MKAEAQSLYISGRSHALSADRLYHAAIEDGVARNPDDPEFFAFNGPYSLSIHYLIGLGLELMLKAAYVALGGENDDRHLASRIGHDLVLALKFAEDQGFHSEAPRLREIVNYLREPYRNHYFRYDRPEQFTLPDFGQMVEAVEVLDREIDTICERAAN